VISQQMVMIHAYGDATQKEDENLVGSVPDESIPLFSPDQIRSQDQMKSKIPFEVQPIPDFGTNTLIVSEAGFVMISLIMIIIEKPTCRILTVIMVRDLEVLFLLRYVTIINTMIEMERLICKMLIVHHFQGTRGVQNPTLQ